METRDDDPALLKVAEAVSDGKPVDWDHEERGHRDDAARDLAQLRALETVAAAYRPTPRHRAGSEVASGLSPGGDPHLGDTCEELRRPAPITRARRFRLAGMVRPLGWLVLALALIVVWLAFEFLPKF